MRQVSVVACLFVFFLAFAMSQEAPNSGDSTKLEAIKTQKADYPIAASRNGIQGQVWLHVLISEKGDIESVDVISGDPILAKAAMDACKRWKFKPYIKNGKAVKVSTKLPFDFYFSDKEINEKIPAARTATSQTSSNDNVGSTQVPSVAPGGDALKRVRASQGVIAGMLIHKIVPVYPASARENRVQGTVILQAVIGKDGRIQKLQPISGPPELVPAAVGAVQQWRYKPYIINGAPVEVETTITVNFELRG